MKQKLLRWPLLLLTSATLVTACSKDDDEGEGNEEEVITTLTLRLTPAGSNTPLQFSYDDPDGPGGNAPTVQAVNLAPNTQYQFQVELLDKTKNPPANITEEVEEEAGEHRVYHLPSAGSNLSFGGLNNDAAGIPLGTRGVLTTGAAASGTLRVVLRHYGGTPPNKLANDPFDSPKSSSDVDVTFNVQVR